MSFLDLAKKRHSVRGYQDTPVPEEALMTVLEAGRTAPSAANLQPWHFVVIRDEVSRKKFKPVYDRDWFVTAPVIIAVCLDTRAAWVRGDRKSYGDVDIGITVDHMTLAAADLGLGTCWIGAFNSAEARRVLKTPDNIEPMVLMPLGYPAAGAVPVKKRKDMSEILSWDVFGGKIR
jgi:nitroreductase